ncbi:MAG: Por secretion system protein [Alistipes sp.]|nr:Por secretion system protein [Alistipes sp.]MBQ5693331.1 Por secretion system protein [Alistipes sp.]
MKKLNLLMLMLCAMFVLASCGNDDRASNKVPGQQKPDSGTEKPDNKDPEEPAGDEIYPLISTDPTFVTSNATTDVIVYINTTGTGLDGYTGAIYAHTGVLTAASTSTGDWKYVKYEWTVNNNSCKLTKVKDNIHKLVIKGGVRAFYGIPASENITHLAFVFRSADGSKEMKDNGNDIFVAISEPGLAVKFIAPADRSILDLNQTYTVSLASIDATSLKLYQNEQLVATSDGKNIKHTFTTTACEDIVFKAEASNDTQTITEVISTTVLGTPQTEARPANAKDGVTLNGNNATIVLYAPGKQSVVLLGDFNDFAPSNKYMMKKDGDYFWYTIDGLTPNTEVAYQFLVDKTIKCGDPYGTMILDPWNDKYINETITVYPNLRPYPTGKTNDVVSVFSTTPATFNWTVTDFQRPKQNSLAIYELLFRDFTAQRSVKAALTKLDHIKALGINAIELMPIQEFDGNNSWGYNPCFYFAADKAYGTVEDYKTFIDECHKRGIAVILDIVINHATGLHPWMKMWCDSDGQASNNNPFFNKVARHPFNVFHDFNHEYAKTREYFKQMLQYWLKEYNIDGYRFDLSKGLTQKNSGSNVGTWNQYDASRIAIIKDYADAIREVEPDAYIILEHLSDYAEEEELANYKGILLWRKAMSAYSETVMGWTGGGKSDFSGAVAFGRVGNIEDHDEERVAYKAIAYGQSYVKSDWGRISKHLQAAYALHFLSPYPKMMWQFGEMGYDISIGSNDGQKVEPKPVHWEYMNVAERKALYDAMCKCITFRTSHQDMYGFEGKPAIQTWAVGDANMAAKTLVYSTASGSVIVMANFTNASSNATCNVPVQGTWKNLITNAAVELNSASYTTTLAPGDYVVLVKE